MINKIFFILVFIININVLHAQKNDIYLYDKNKFRFFTSCSVCPTSTIKGMFSIKDDSIVFNCDPIYKLSYYTSKQFNNDSIDIIFVNLDDANLPFIFDLNILNNTDTILKIENYYFTYNKTIRLSKAKKIKKINIIGFGNTQLEEIKWFYNESSG